MKTTKTKKKELSEKKANSKIKDYFKTASKEKVESSSKNVKSVYVDALLEKLKSLDDEGDSLLSESGPRREENGDDIDAMTSQATDVDENETNGCTGECNKNRSTERVDKNKANGCTGCEQWRQKYEELKKSYVKLSLRYSDKVLKYDELVHTSTSTQRCIAEGRSDEAQTSSASDEVFTENELKCLQSLSLDKKKDSTFILHCVRYAYKNNPAELSKKTLKGTRGRFEMKDGNMVEVKPAKNPLTPEKIGRIQRLFIDRVTKSKCLAGEFGERVNLVNIHKHIANAIKNISNQQNPSEAMSNPNSELNL